jgi:hypothetical protein
MRDYLQWRGVPKDREEPLFVRICGGHTSIMATHTASNVERIPQDRTSGLGEPPARRTAESRGVAPTGPAARARWAAAHADIALCAQLTLHWFRHLLTWRHVEVGRRGSSLAIQCRK